MRVSSIGCVQSGPAMALSERVLWIVNAGAQQDRSMPAFITLASLLDAALAGRTDDVGHVIGAVRCVEAGRRSEPGRRLLLRAFHASRDARRRRRAQCRGDTGAAADRDHARCIVSDPPAADGGMGIRPELLTGVLREGELLYAYDCNPRAGVDDETQASGAHSRACRLRRVPATQFSDGSRYEFYRDVPEFRTSRAPASSSITSPVR